MFMGWLAQMFNVMAASSLLVRGPGMLYFHSWTKLLLSSCSNCLLISWVTRIWSLMDLVHNNSPQICYIWNVNYVLISKKSIFFQFISLIPLLKTLLLQFVFYLLIQFISSSMINNLLPQIYWQILRDATCISCIFLPSASATLFSFPFLCLISKSNSHRNSSHLACLAFRVG